MRIKAPKVNMTLIGRGSTDHISEPGFEPTGIIERTPIREGLPYK